MAKEYILLKSFSGSLNMGDEAMLSSNLNVFRKRLDGKYRFIVLSINPKLTSALHNVESKPTFTRLFGKWTRIGGRLKILWLAARLLWNAVRVKKGKPPKLLNRIELDFLYAFVGCRAFFLVGCGLHDTYSSWGIFSNNVMILLAVILNKPVFLGAQTFALSKIWNRWFTKYVLKRVQLITVRESVSKKILKQIGIKNVKLVCDDAFDIKPLSRSEATKLLQKEGIDLSKLKKEGKKLVMVNIRPLWKRRNASRKLKEVFTAVVKFLTKNGCFIIFVPMSYRKGTYTDDVQGAVEVVKNAKINNKNYRILKDVRNWRQIKGILSLSDLAIGVSYHFCVFSISCGIPTIGLYQDKYYQTKLGGFFEFLGLKHFVIDVSQEDSTEIVDKISKALEKEELKQTFKVLTKDIRKKFEPCYAAKKLVQFLEPY